MKFFFILIITFLFSPFFAQQKEMTNVASNYSTFPEKNISPSIEKWKLINSPSFYQHPEFGILPYNAPCTDCIEDLSKRMENEKYFISTSNSSVFYQQKSYGAINFYKNGNWLTIDERLKKIDNNLFFAENQIDPTGLNTQQKNAFIKTPLGTVQFNNWKLKGLKNNVNYEIATADWSDYTVGENGIYIKNIFKGIDLELKFSRGSIKSNFVVVKNYFSEFESLIFEDEFNSNSPGYFVFENSSKTTRGVGELLYKVNSENTLEIGMALIYPQGLEKEKSQNAEYIIHENKMGIVIPMDWINENLNENNRLIIDPVVSSTNTLAQASITGSGYNATCFNGFCSYNLIVPTPANAAVTDAQWSFNYRAISPCYRSEGAVTFLLGTCRSPAQNNLFWFCNQNPQGPGDCLGTNISIYNDISSCLPAPSCTPQNLNFTMRFHRCWSSGSGCSNSCIGAISPWTMTIVGRTLEYTNSTPITLNNTTVCQGGTINASTAASFGVPPYNYNWSLNSNMSPSNGSGTSSTFSFPNSGTFTIYSTVTDACGTVVNSSRTVTVNPSPTVTITPNPQTICSGQGTGLTLTSSVANTSYTWSTSMSGVTGATNSSGTGTGVNSSLNLNQTLTNNGTTPGTATYTITPTATSCPGTPVAVIVTVNPSPTVTNPGNQTICTGQNSTAVTFSGTSGATFNWTNNNTSTGLGASGTGNIASFLGQNTSTTNNVSNITVTPTFGTCPGTAQNFSITVSPPPTVNNVASQTLCAGQQTTAVTFSGTATTYSWANNNTAIGLGASGTGNMAAFTATNSTANPITATISITPTSGTCQGTPTTFTITVNPSPTATAPQDQSICAGQSTTAVTFSGSAGATFNWSNNNTATGLGASGTGNIASFIGTNSTTGPIISTVTVTPSANGCNGTPVTFTITINITPIMTAPTSQTLCAGQQTTAVTFSGTATTYSWANNNTSIGLGASGTGNIVAFTATNSTANPITATISITPTSGTCQGTPTTFTITVNPSPTATAPQDQSICAGQSTTAITFSGSAGATFNWSNNNTATGLGASGTGNIASFVGTNSTTGPIISTVTVTPSANSCNGTPITFTITINITPTMTAPTSQTLCAGQQTTAVTFSGTATTYSWANNNTAIGLGSSGTGNIVAFTATNSTANPITATISITPTSGTCQGTPTTFTITVNPSVNTTFNPIAPICQNTTAPPLPTSSINSPAVIGTWNPNTISTTTVGSFTYNFTPNAGQCANPVSITVQISPLISPSFNQIGPLCQNSGVTLPTSSTNTPAITGTWNPSTVNTSSTGSTTYTFTPNPNQCSSNATMVIQVNLIPTVTLTSQSICSGQTISIIPIVTPTGGTYLWSNNSTASSLSVSPTQTTTYNLLYSLNGCNATGSGIVNVTQNATPTFTALGPYCQNTAAEQLSSTSINSIQGTWNPSIINTSNPGNTIYTFTPNTGLCANTATMNIIVNPLVTPTFNQIGPLCQNDNSPILPINSNNTPSITGSWNPTVISTANVGSTNYTFTPTIGQCATNTTMSIAVTATPQPTINSNITSGCAPLNVVLSTTTASDAIFNWTSNGINIGSTPTLNSTFSNAGCYDIGLTVSLGSCQSTTAINDLICVEAAPTALFNIFPNSFSNSTETIQFSNNSIGATSFSWDFGDGQTSSETDPAHIYNGINSNILATLTAVSSLGCTSSFSVVISYQEETIFYVPNTFTPDEDEFNQTWGPVFSQGFDEFNFNMIVYNRWGEIVWESKDAKGRWDGNYGINGLKCPQGTYTWKIDYKPKETDKKLTITGQVNLLR